MESGYTYEGDYAPALWPWLGPVRALAGDDPDPLLAPLLDDSITSTARSLFATALGSH